MIVRVRDDAETRTITIVDRVTIRGAEFAIVNVNQPDRRGGSIEIALQQKVSG